MNNPKINRTANLYERTFLNRDDSLIENPVENIQMTITDKVSETQILYQKNTLDENAHAIRSYVNYLIKEKKQH